MAFGGTIKTEPAKTTSKEFVTLHTGQKIAKKKYEKMLKDAQGGKSNQPPPLKKPDPSNN
ncbi:MAG: hypothetical protein KBC11_02030 [Candidatus Pacebacteria bacterium]|nr:hypothetical protein [Candidatus Paceibacterota bacterium]